MKNLSFFTLFVLSMFLVACNNDDLEETQQDANQNDAQYYIDLAEDMLAEDDEELEFRGNVVTVPAVSQDALQAAVDQAGPNGTVILAAGEHTEESTVTITHRMNIRGEEGAILKFNTAEDLDYEFPSLIDPGLHILNTSRVVIENITFKSTDGLAGTAILCQNTSRVHIRNNTFLEHTYCIIQDYADYSRIYNNNLVSAWDWCFINVNGNYTRFYNNISGPIFVSDKGGLIFENLFNDFLGILFCTAADPTGGPGYLEFTDGTYSNTAEPANRWLCVNNTVENAYSGNGITIIDGAHDNTLVNNNVIGPVNYGIEMVGFTERNGFPSPTSYDNLVVSTAYPDVIIKVCGENNVAIGGNQVDTDADPCN